jgi:GNAT superfamily N-acetyltransferase
MMREAFPVVGGNALPGFFEYFQTNDPHYQPSQLRIGVKDGRIVATVRVMLRDAWDGDAYVPMGGIANVAVHPDFRGQGLSVPLLQDSVDFMRSQGCAFSTLYSGHHGLYEKVGSHFHTRGILNGKVPGTVGAIPSSSDVSRATQIYALQRAKLPGAFLRSDEYWRRWVKDYKLLMYKLVYSPDGRAYAFYNADDSKASAALLEAGYDGDAANLTRLIRSTFSGRILSMPHVEPNDPAYQPIVEALEDVELNEVHSPMVSGICADKLPSTWHETIVDFF